MRCHVVDCWGRYRSEDEAGFQNGVPVDLGGEVSKGLRADPSSTKGSFDVSLAAQYPDLEAKPKPEKEVGSGEIYVPRHGELWDSIHAYIAIDIEQCDFACP